MIELNIGNKNIIYSDSYLSVINRADRFFYAIFDDNHTIREASLKPVDLSKIKELILRGCNNKIIAVNGPSLHLPDGLPGKNYLEKYTLTLPHTSYLSEGLIGNEAATYYSLSRPMAETLGDVVSAQEVIHLTTAITNYLYPAINEKVFVLLGKGYMYFCLYTPIGLKFINSYTCHDEYDVLYYLNLCLSQLALDPVDTKVEFGGNIERNSPLASMISDYLGNWRFFDPALLKVEDSGSDWDKHLFHELYITYLCAL